MASESLFQKFKNTTVMRQKNVMKICGNLVNETGNITLKPNTLTDFPVLTQYGIPLDKFSVSSVLRGLYSYL
jgi:hypothetical protein